MHHVKICNKIILSKTWWVFLSKFRPITIYYIKNIQGKFRPKAIQSIQTMQPTLWRYVPVLFDITRTNSGINFIQKMYFTRTKNYGQLIHTIYGQLIQTMYATRTNIDIKFIKTIEEQLIQIVYGTRTNVDRKFIHTMQDMQPLYDITSTNNELYTLRFNIAH